MEKEIVYKIKTYGDFKLINMVLHWQDSNINELLCAIAELRQRQNQGLIEPLSKEFERTMDAFAKEYGFESIELYLAQKGLTVNEYQDNFKNETISKKEVIANYSNNDRIDRLIIGSKTVMGVLWLCYVAGVLYCLNLISNLNVSESNIFVEGIRKTIVNYTIAYTIGSGLLLLYMHYSLLLKIETLKLMVNR